MQTPQTKLISYKQILIQLASSANGRLLIQHVVAAMHTFSIIPTLEFAHRISAIYKSKIFN